jgi:hypothetical protein
MTARQPALSLFQGKVPKPARGQVSKIASLAELGPMRPDNWANSISVVEVTRLSASRSPVDCTMTKGIMK